MIYVKQGNGPGRLLHTVDAFYNDIGLGFGLDKRSKATSPKRKLKTSYSVVLDDDRVIKSRKGTHLKIHWNK